MIPDEPIKLTIVRHAETYGMTKGVRLNNEDPLSNNGLDQAKKLAKKLLKSKFHYVYTSPTLRAQQTLNIIKKYCYCNKIYEDTDLVERKEATSLIGVKTEDMPWDEIKKHRLKRHWKYQDSESFHEIFNRALKLLNKFEKHKPGSHILIMSHGSFIRALFAVILMEENLTPRQYFKMTEKLFIESTGVSKLEFSKKYYEESPTWKIITWMDISHLE